MIDRYSRPQMAAVFADQAKVDMWLAVEKAVLASLVAEGVAPREAWDALEPVTTVDPAMVREREAEIHHDMAAFVDVVGAEAPGCAAWLHYGLTSSDVVDTGLALQLQQAGAIVLEGIAALREDVLERAHAERDTVMLGRTHGMPAEPITFGAKLAGWWHQLGRDEERVRAALEGVRVGKCSGAVGLWSGVSADVERRVLAALGLARDESATQVVQRDRHSALLSALALCAATVERIGTEVRHLQRSEVAEAAEPFASGQKGSSAMPHKRNPITAERLCGLARVVRANAMVGLEDVALWHERDISHSSAERVVLPDSFLARDNLLAKARWLVSGLVVDRQRMLDNVLEQRGLVSSQRVLLAMVARGVARDDAYRIVQRAAMSVHAGDSPHLGVALAEDEEAMAVLEGFDVGELTDDTAVPDGVDEAFAALPPPGA